MSKRLNFAVMVIAAVGLVVLADGRAARAANYTITVDGSKQTAGNPRFWSAAVGTGTASLTLRSDLQTHYKLANRELGMLRVRGHGVLNDDMGIYKGAGSYDWTNFDKYLNAIVSAGMRPLMELDFMPTALALTGNSRDIYKDVNAYKQFIQALIQHCIDRYGATDVGQWYWEVWNEPDYPGFWNGTMASEAVAAKMTDYYAFYDATVDAATVVLPGILVGGPVTTEPSKIAAFLQHCKTANKRVTFVSSHVYPGGAAGGTTANATGLVTDNTTRISQITSGGYTTAQVKSFNTEWNSSYSGQGGQLGDVLTAMDNHWNVGFILKGVKLLSDKNSGDTPPLDVFSYWVLSDVFGEYSGDAGSYIASKGGGTLPFGQVFGLMTYQGVRKAAFNAFKLLNYLGPKRLMSGGGTGSDGVDAMATTSASGDEIQILVYDYYATMNTTGTDMVTVTLSNLPSTLAGKSVFVTQFVVDETHSNPYSVWAGQGKPTAPSETQWQQMKAAQHLALLQPVSKTTLGTTYTSTFAINRQGASLLILGVNRPVTGRNALVEIEGEDYDGQSGVTKEDSNDSATVGQSITGGNGAVVFFDNVDFSDAGVGTVALRVNAQSATTLTLRADSTAGTVIGTCQVAATGGSWATQTCALAPTTGVHTLYVSFGGTVRLNNLKFQAGSGSTGTGGAGGSGAGGRGGSGGGAGGSTNPGTGGSSNPGSGGSGSGGSGSGGTTGPGAGGATGPGAGGTGMVSGAGGDIGAGAGGSGSSGSGGGGGDTSVGSGGSNSAGIGGSTGAGGSTPAAGGGGCGCGVGGAGASGRPLGSLAPFALVAAALVLGRRRARRRI
jgi:xylan 1,4-beta-xylosidase